jgi:pectate lyase
MKHSAALDSGRFLHHLAIASLACLATACSAPSPSRTPDAATGADVAEDQDLATVGTEDSPSAAADLPAVGTDLPPASDLGPLFPDAAVGQDARPDQAVARDTTVAPPDLAPARDTTEAADDGARDADAATTPTPDTAVPTDAMAATRDTDPGAIVSQGAVVFTSFGGWFEAGYATWNPVTGASGYQAYYKKAADTDWVAVDAALLRDTRVDVPGLAGGVPYHLKVVPVLGGAASDAQATTVAVAPMSHDRSGFAFAPASPNGNANGGYQGDGTPKPDARILYVSETTKDTVEMAVTKGNTTTTYQGIGAIMAARQSAQTEIPLIIRLLGKVTPPAGVDSLSLLNIKATKNVTVEGIGTDAMVYAWGLNIRAATNVEVRNLAFSMFTDDSVSIQVDNHNIWIHHNDFMVGTGTGDKELGDGSCDIKDNSNYITVSYNHFIGTGKSSLVGMNDSAEFFVTFHHNFFDGSGSRHPRVRWGSVHVYNNYYRGNTTYGAAASEYSNLFVQNNTFESCVRPMIIASQGHDYKDLVPAGQTPGKHESILSGEPGGSLKQEGNDLDAVSQSWFDPAVDTGNGSSGAYNGFDSKLAANGYPCALDGAADAVPKILAFAGRLGD